MGTFVVGWWGVARMIGAIGERIVGDKLGFAKNTTRLYVDGVQYRIPDFIDRATRTYHEGKAASYWRVTPQIRDTIEIARVRTTLINSGFTGAPRSRRISKTSSRRTRASSRFNTMNGGKELKWANAPALEQKILADIYTKTGWAFGRVGGIRTGDPFIADRVLPILVDWYPLMEDPGYRAEIACRFHYATAHAFLHIVLDWWQRETDRVPREYLTQVVAELTQAEDAELVWGVFQQVPRDPFSVFILQKLARYKPTSQAARDEAVRMLQEGPPGYGPLEAISHIDDVRVRRWFREHSNDADPGIKKLASRLLKRGKALLLELTAPSMARTGSPSSILSKETSGISRHFATTWSGGSR